MGYYQPMQKLLTTEFLVNKEGFWRPAYQLTDGQYSYGKLCYEGFWLPDIIMETAGGKWIIDVINQKQRPVKNEKGEVLATLSRNFWDTKVTFTAKDGFIAIFEKHSIWKGLAIWKDIDGDDILSIEPRIFKQPVIKFNPKAKQNKWLLMLAFLALQINLERQRKAAVAASV